MNKDEIKKALECCDSYVQNACAECPYCYVGKCRDKLQHDALSLINKQEQEIERLKANGYRSIMDAFENNGDKITENIQTEIDDYKHGIKQAKIDVLKELKTRYDYAIKNMGYPFDMYTEIDEMIKEIEQ